MVLGKLTGHIRPMNFAAILKQKCWFLTTFYNNFSDLRSMWLVKSSRWGHIYKFLRIQFVFIHIIISANVLFSGKSTLLAVLGNREVPIPDHIDIFHLTREAPASDKSALKCVMEVDQERVRLEKLAEELIACEDDGKLIRVSFKLTQTKLKCTARYRYNSYVNLKEYL